MLFLLKAIVSVVLLGVLFANADLAGLSAALRQASVGWLAAALGLYLVMILTSAWRWNLLLSAQRISVSGRLLVNSFLVATFFNHFLPSNIGGDVIRIRDTTAPAGSLSRATAIVVLDRGVGLLALLFVAAVGGTMAALTATGHALPLTPGWLWASFAAAGGAFVLLVGAPDALGRLLHPTRLVERAAIRQRIDRLLEMLRTFRGDPVPLVACFAGAILAQAVLVAFYVAIAYSLQIPISVLHLAVVVPMSFVVQLLPISVNGFGVREATFTYYFGALNLPVESALVLSLVGAGLVLVFSLSGGLLYLARR